MVAVEVPDPLEQLRPAGLHRLIFRDQKPPLLQVVAFNRPVVAVVAHRIVLQRSDPISELVNMHSNDEIACGAWLRLATSLPDRETSMTKLRLAECRPFFDAVVEKATEMGVGVCSAVVNAEGHVIALEPT